MSDKLDELQQWLIKTEKFTAKSAGDVCSRVRRVRSLLQLKGTESYNVVLSRLDDSKEFARLSVFVKAQLKRAIRLSYDFEK